MKDRDAFRKTVWPDMLALYRRDGIAPLCLRLQDDHDVDVPLLLVLLLADHAGIGASGAEMRALIEGASFWRETAVCPLRAVRRALKPHVVEPEEGAFRESVKRLELEAERIHVARLACAIVDMRGGAAALVSRYLVDRGLSAEATERTLEAFLAALEGLPSRLPSETTDY